MNDIFIHVFITSLFNYTDGVYDNALTTYELCRYLPLCRGVAAAIERTPATVVLPECTTTLRRHPTQVTVDGSIERNRIAIVALAFVGTGELMLFFRCSIFHETIFFLLL